MSGGPARLPGWVRVPPPGVVDGRVGLLGEHRAECAGPQIKSDGRGGRWALRGPVSSRGPAASPPRHAPAASLLGARRELPPRARAPPRGTHEPLASQPRRGRGELAPSSRGSQPRAGARRALARARRELARPTRHPRTPHEQPRRARRELAASPRRARRDELTASPPQVHREPPPRVDGSAQAMSSSSSSSSSLPRCFSLLLLLAPSPLGGQSWPCAAGRSGGLSLPSSPGKPHFHGSHDCLPCLGRRRNPGPLRCSRRLPSASLHRGCGAVRRRLMIAIIDPHHEAV